MKPTNKEISTLAEEYANERATKGDDKNWMQVRCSYRAGFFAAMKALAPIDRDGVLCDFITWYNSKPKCYRSDMIYLHDIQNYLKTIKPNQ